MTRPRVLTDEQLASIHAWRRAGKSYEFIARRVGCSQSAVRHQCRLACIVPAGTTMAVSNMPMVTSRNGVQVRRYTAEEDQIIRAMKSAGHGPTEIGRALGRRSGSIHCRIVALNARQALSEAA